MSGTSDLSNAARKGAFRFNTGVPIGRGASGQVLRSWDPQLERPVALKLLARDDPESIARMVREARSQARVDHPNVCKIYEVGELDGRPYIAMQYIDGRPLDQAARELSIEQRVELVATVADAVAAAHRAGLVHRDLKPANILVEENGGLTPYVLDFGIARERDFPGLTQTGQVIGTPGYMAPEQARGDVHAIGRRTDVFSLGVVLYHLLGGEPPFAGSSSAEVLVSLLSESYRPLRKVNRAIPQDLATIVHKALEYDPERRYASAAELRDDLERWLAGDPIEARPATVGYRLAKRVRKHPKVASAALGALLLLVTVVFATRVQAQRQLELAERFGDRVQNLTTRLDLAYRLPKHDIAPEQQIVAAELETLDREIAEMGRLARGPGELALGRGYLALGRFNHAREHLDKARAAGYDSPALALALGRTLSELYLREISALTTIADAELRLEARRRAESELVEPARELLERARNARLGLEEHELAFVSGLLALHKNDVETALVEARAAGERAWFQQAQLLEASIHSQRASEALITNELETARESLVAARSALAAVVAKAPSDPRGYVGLCRTALLDLQRFDAAGGSIARPYLTAQADCTSALEVDSESLDALLHRSEAAWRMARATTRKGLDPEAELEAAIADAERARENAPFEPRALSQLAAAWAVHAERTSDIGGDPFPAWSRSADHLRVAIEQAPGDGLLRLELANVLTQWGQNLSFTGADPLPIWREAREAVRRAEEAPEVLAAHLDLGLCRVETEIGYYLFQRGESPGSSFDDAVAACRSAQPALPGHLQAKHNLGYALWSRAEHEAASGADPRESFRDAAAAFEGVLAIDPDRSTTRVNTAHLLEELAAWKVEHGEAAGDVLTRAEHFNRSIAKVYPPDFHLIQGKIERVRALDRLARGEDPAEAFAAAERHGLAAAELQPDRIAEQAPLVELYRRRALWLHAEGRTEAARRDADAGLEWAKRALALERDQPRVVAAMITFEELLSPFDPDPESVGTDPRS